MKELPLYEQIYVRLRESIVAGQLVPGARVASSRALAKELAVSRFTVVSAVERLLAEGYLTTRRGSGTYVVRTLPEKRMRAPRSTPNANARANAQALANAALPPVLSDRGRALSGVVITGPRSEDHEARPFRPRRPPLDVFPFRLWARLVRRQWSSFKHHHLDYGEPAGFRPLREAIARHVGVTRGVRCSMEQVIVTSGAQQAFDILFRLLLDPGDAAWIEEPGYLDVRAALIASGARIVPVTVDAQGIDVDAGIRLARRARLALVSPSHQYPTGVTLSAARRNALLAWASQANEWIIEDDYDSYFRYRGRPLSALQRLDADAADSQTPPGERRVVYVGTFSKTMFPSLRLGYCVVPEWLAGSVANARAVADRNSPIADQATLADFIGDGHYDRHLRRVRVACEERYDAMRFHCNRALDGAMTLGAAAAGTHVLGRLRDENTRARRPGARHSLAVHVSKAAAEDGLVVFPLSRYYLTPPPVDALVLGYGGLTPERIATGIDQLARAIERGRRNRSLGRRV